MLWWAMYIIAVARLVADGWVVWCQGAITTVYDVPAPGRRFRYFLRVFRRHIYLSLLSP